MTAKIEAMPMPDSYGDTSIFSIVKNRNMTPFPKFSYPNRNIEYGYSSSNRSQQERVNHDSRSFSNSIENGNASQLQNISHPQQFSFDNSSILSENALNDLNKSNEGIVLLSSKEFEKLEKEIEESKKITKSKGKNEKRKKGIKHENNNKSEDQSNSNEDREYIGKDGPAHKRKSIDILPTYFPQPTIQEIGNGIPLEDDPFLYAYPTRFTSSSYNTDSTHQSLVPSSKFQNNQNIKIISNKKNSQRYNNNDHIVDIVFDYGKDPFVSPFSSLLKENIHTVEDFSNHDANWYKEREIPFAFLIWCTQHGITVPGLKYEYNIYENFGNYDNQFNNLNQNENHNEKDQIERKDLHIFDEDGKSILSLGNLSEPHVEIVRKDLPPPTKELSIFNPFYWLNKLRKTNISIRCDNNSVRGELIVKMGKRRIIMHTVHDGYTVSEPIGTCYTDDDLIKDKLLDDTYNMNNVNSRLVDLSDLPLRIRTLIKDSVEEAKSDIMNQFTLGTMGNISNDKANYYPTYTDEHPTSNERSLVRYNNLSRFGKQSYSKKRFSNDENSIPQKKRYTIRFDEDVNHKN